MSNSLADNLAGYWLVNESGGNTIYDLSGNGNNMTNSGGTWITGNSVEGVNVAVSNSYFSTPQAITPSSLEVRYPCSFVCAMQKNTTWTNAGTNLFTLSRNAGVSAHIRVASATQFRLSYLSGGSNGSLTITSGLPTQGVDCVVGVTLTSTSYIWYFNGVAVQTGSISTSNPTFIDAFAAFRPAGQTGDTAPINVYWGGIWNRVLTPTEMADIVAQPYAFLDRPRQPFFGGTAPAMTSNLIYQAMIG